MERIKLNLIPSGVAPIVHLSQYDDGRQFGIDLFEGESVYVLDGTETLTVNSRKPDGHIVTLTVTNTGTSSLDVDVIEQLTAVHGVSYAKLKIEKGSVTIATLPFLIDVSRDPLENGDPSESFVDNLQTQIALAVSDQYDSANVVFDANPTAGHGVGFAVTSEGVKDAIDNAVSGLSIPDELNDLSDVTITTPSNGEILVYNNGTWENQANPASTQNFAPDYDDTATYNTNDKVIYQGLLYVCLEDSVTGAWDGTKWQQISVADLNAELLPIQSGSATNTKAYIDTALSGKQDTLTTINDTFSASANITLLRPLCVKYGNIKQLSCVFRVDGTVSNVGTIPNAYKPTYNIDFSAVGDNGNGARLRIQANSNTIEISNALSSSSEYFAFTVCYI